LQSQQKTIVKKNAPPVKPEEMKPEEKHDFEAQNEINEARLDILEPEGNAEVNTPSITIKGKAESGAQVMVAGQAATPDQSGFFTAAVNLVEGKNIIKIETTNSKGSLKVWC